MPSASAEQLVAVAATTVKSGRMSRPTTGTRARAATTSGNTAYLGLGHDADGLCQLDILDHNSQDGWPYGAMVVERVAERDDTTCCVITFSLQSQNSWDYATSLYERIEAGRKERSQQFPVVIAGTKADEVPDSERELYLEAKSWCKERAVLFIETSAKTNKNVDALFNNLIRIAPRAPDNKYTVVMLGFSGSGKTALTLRFVQDLFDPDSETITDVYTKSIRVKGVGKGSTVSMSQISPQPLAEVASLPSHVVRAVARSAPRTSIIGALGSFLRPRKRQPSTDS